MCVACFTGTSQGHWVCTVAGVVQYFRPEIIGIVIGSFASALAFREFRPRTGSGTLVRFFGHVRHDRGAGIPGLPLARLPAPSRRRWHRPLRHLGLAIGIAVGVFFLKKGFSPGTHPAGAKAMGWVMPC